MKKRIFNLISIVLALSVLSSCATIPGIGQGMKSSTMPRNSEEKKIFTQAILTGAVIGSVTGFAFSNVICKRVKNKNNRLKCKVGGTLLAAAFGAVVGLAAATGQISQFREVKLENDQLEALLNSAKRYNQQMVVYNNDLKMKIASVKTKSIPEQKEMAKELRKQVNQDKILLDKAIKQRKKISNAISENQKYEYEKTLISLEEEKVRLVASIKELENMEIGIIGS